MGAKIAKWLAKQRQAVRESASSTAEPGITKPAASQPAIIETEFRQLCPERSAIEQELRPTATWKSENQKLQQFAQKWRYQTPALAYSGGSITQEVGQPTFSLRPQAH